MEIKVHFRYNKITGEVELFEVDDEGPMRLPEAEHNRQHDRIAANIGNLIERNPRVDEVLPGTEVGKPVNEVVKPGIEVVTGKAIEKPSTEEEQLPEIRKGKQSQSS